MCLICCIHLNLNPNLTNSTPRPPAQSISLHYHFNPTTIPPTLFIECDTLPSIIITTIIIVVVFSRSHELCSQYISSSSMTGSSVLEISNHSSLIHYTMFLVSGDIYMMILPYLSRSLVAAPLSLESVCSVSG